MMNRTLALLILSCFIPVCAAEKMGDTVLDISFPQMKKDEKLLAGEVDEKIGGLQIKAGAQQSQTILVLEQPKVSSSIYMLRGKVRYENIAGKGFLEMWSYFADGEAYFSRTLGTAGPMAALSGNSDWRDFELPFDSTGAKAKLQKIVLNVVLPAGSGTVSLKDVRLVEFKTSIMSSDYKKNETGGWWSDEVGGIVGGLLGMVVGFGGALIGFLSVRGKARGFTIGLIKTIIFVSVVALLAGIAALILKQPYGVYYPLLIAGVLGIAIPLGLLPVIHKRYADAELRKMQAMDA